jgi:hypothetical protein
MKSLGMVVAAVTLLAAGQALAHGLAEVSVYDRTEGRRDSYAARTGRPDDVGVIGVALFRRKALAVTPEISAPAAAPRAAERDDARLGTGHGRQETSHARHVTFERATSSPAEIVTLYYDSHANLVARGVIRDAVQVAPTPRPFPGFVPDPAG